MVVQNAVDMSVAKNNVAKDGDVSCWNCFTVEDSDKKHKQTKPEVTLKALRKQEREKFKLYAFVANELSRPKAVPLKQKVSTNYAVAKKLDQEITKSYNVQEPMKVEDNKTSEKILNHLDAPVANNLSEQEPDIQTIVPKNVGKSLETPVKTIGLSKLDNTRIDASPTNITNRVKIETSTPKTILRQSEELSKLHYSTIIEVKKKDQITLNFEEVKKRNKKIISSSNDELDKIEEASSSGSDSGYTASSLPHDVNDVIKSDENIAEVVPIIEKASTLGRSPLPTDHEIPRIKSKDIFKRSLPTLNSSNETSAMVSSSNSLCTDNNTSPQKTPKTLRWSTLSFHQKPLFNGM